jgi:hypothetical protein
LTLSISLGLVSFNGRHGRRRCRPRSRPGLSVPYDHTRRGRLRVRTRSDHLPLEQHLQRPIRLLLLLRPSLPRRCHPLRLFLQLFFPECDPVLELPDRATEVRMDLGGQGEERMKVLEFEVDRVRVGQLVSRVLLQDVESGSTWRRGVRRWQRECRCAGLHPDIGRYVHVHRIVTIFRRRVVVIGFALLHLDLEGGTE